MLPSWEGWSGVGFQGSAGRARADEMDAFRVDERKVPRVALADEMADDPGAGPRERWACGGLGHGVRHLRNTFVASRNAFLRQWVPGIDIERTRLRRVEDGLPLRSSPESYDSGAYSGNVRATRLAAEARRGGR